MAVANPNQNTPSGFNVDRQGNGGIVRLNQYYIASALAALIFRGSVVIPTGTSKQITVAAAGNKFIGVFHGVNFVDTGGNTQFKPYWPTGQTLQTGSIAAAQIYDDPNMMFSVQASGTGLTAANLGLLADLVIGTGNTTTGQSGDQLDQTTIGTSGSQFLIDDVDAQGAPLGLNLTLGQFSKAIVRCAKHYLGAALTAL